MLMLASLVAADPGWPINRFANSCPEELIYPIALRLSVWGEASLKISETTHKEGL